MGFLTINNFSDGGLNTDLPQHHLGPEFITSCNNIHNVNQSIESVLGPIDYTSVPVAFNSGKLQFVKSGNTNYIVSFGRSKVKAFDTIWNDITGSASADLPLLLDAEIDWQSVMFGGIMIANHFQAYPYYWAYPNAVGVPLAYLKFDAGNTWKAKNKSARVFRPHGRFLFALNLREGVNYYPDAYRWSHPADTNGLPFTWDETDLSAIAGFDNLGGDTGVIIDGLSLRQSFIIYSDKAVTTLVPSGNESIWRKSIIDNSVGLLARDCVQEINGRHVFLSEGDIMQTDGNSVSSIAQNKIKTFLKRYSNSENISRSYTVKDPIKNEVWFCLTDASKSYPTVAIIYNWGNNTWSISDLPATASHAISGKKIYTQLTNDGNVGINDTDNVINDYSPIQPSAIFCNNVNDDSIDILNDESSAVAVTTTIERIGLRFENESITTINKVYPVFDGSGTVQIEVGSMEVPNGSVTWEAAQDFIIGTDRSLDVRSTGLLHCWRVTGSVASKWRLIELTFSYEVQGIR